MSTQTDSDSKEIAESGSGPDTATGELYSVVVRRLKNYQDRKLYIDLSKCGLEGNIKAKELVIVDVGDGETISKQHVSQVRMAYARYVCKHLPKEFSFRIQKNGAIANANQKQKRKRNFRQILITTNSDLYTFWYKLRLAAFYGVLDESQLIAAVDVDDLKKKTHKVQKPKNNAGADQAQKNGFKNTPVLEWTGKDVYDWVQKFGRNATKKCTAFCTLTGAELVSFECASDLKQLMPNATQSFRCTIFSKIAELKKAHAITNHTTNGTTKTKADESDDSMASPRVRFEDKRLLDWTAQDVYDWVQTLGRRARRKCKCPAFAALTGVRLVMFESASDLSPFMATNATQRDHDTIFEQIVELKKAQGITNKTVVQLKKKLNGNRSSAGVVGLHNLGNTCFLNSSIQVLAQTPGLVPVLKNYAQQQRSRTRAQTQQNSSWYNFSSNSNYYGDAGTKANMLNAVSSLVLESRTAKQKPSSWSSSWYGHTERNVACIDPGAVYRALRTCSPHLCDGAQHDAADSLACILNALDGDLNKNARQNSPARYKEAPWRSEISLCEQKLRLLRTREDEIAFLDQMFKKFNPNDSVVRRVMTGILKYDRRCVGCSSRTVTYESFDALHIPIVRKRQTDIKIEVHQAIPATTATATARRRNTSSCVCAVSVAAADDDSVTVLKARVYTRLVAEAQANGAILDGVDLDDSSLVFVAAPRKVQSNNLNVASWLKSDVSPCGEGYAANASCHTTFLVANAKKTGLFNAMALVIVDDSYRFCRFLQFKHGKRIRGAQLLKSVAVYCNPQAVTQMQKRRDGVGDLHLRILLDGEFVHNNEMYTMDEVAHRCFVSVWVSTAFESKLRKLTIDPGVYGMVSLSLFNRLPGARRKTKSDEQRIMKSLARLDANAAVGSAGHNVDDADLRTKIRSTYEALNAMYKLKLKIARIVKNAFATNTNTNANVTSKSKSTFARLSDSLGAYFQPKLEINATNCAKCLAQNRKCAAVFCETSIARAPTNLVLRIARTAQIDEKNNTFMAYPSTKALQVPVLNATQLVDYSLYGVCCHVGGGTRFGHYFAFVKSLEDAEWYSANDTSVSKDAARVVNRNAILLLFTKDE